MGHLETFLHDEKSNLPLLVRAGLVHVQFETIHPLLDGNGRAGRLLITLLLCSAGVLREPLLYLSLYLKQHRSEYYNLLIRVRQDGDWEAWLAFFLEGVRVTADDAVRSARRILDLFQRDRTKVENLGRKAGSILRVFDLLRTRAALTASRTRNELSISFPTAKSALDALLDLGIVREITGGTRNQVYAYTDYVSILSEGTEPLRS